MSALCPVAGTGFVAVVCPKGRDGMTFSQWPRRTCRRPHHHTCLFRFCCVECTKADCIDDDNEGDLLHQLSEALRVSLQLSETGLSKPLEKGLLAETPTDVDDDDTAEEKSDEGEYEKSQETDVARVIFKGVPRRPFYRDIARRLLFLLQHKMSFSMNEMGNHPSYDSPRPLVSAASLGLEEEMPPALIPMPPSAWMNVDDCTKWFREAGDGGVLELLGLRTTVGTGRFMLPPSVTELEEAARISHRPDSAPPHATVAARARTKHAHRGGSQSIFGTIRGGRVEQNQVTERIVSSLLRDAIWVNIHAFGGTGAPALEVRIASGYGARWSAEWIQNNPDDPFLPINVTFRGFLEPQMENGHEKKWRH
eukprot:scaffold126363_cov52-Attheya_sp.AAC.1